MPSILIVDDDPYIVKLLKMILETDGYTVSTALDGNAGLKSFRDQRPDLSIIDIVMPEKEGLETITELMRIDPSALIIAISGGGAASPHTYLPIAEKLGAAETMVKPIDKDELLHKVKSVLAAS